MYPHARWESGMLLLTRRKQSAALVNFEAIEACAASIETVCRAVRKRLAGSRPQLYLLFCGKRIFATHASGTSCAMRSWIVTDCAFARIAYDD
jgi:hypothetical protein